MSQEWSISPLSHKKLVEITAADGKSSDPFTQFSYKFQYPFLRLSVRIAFRFQVCFCGVHLYPHLFACLFACLLCSAAELTRRHFARAADMVQLKRVISQNTLMMVVELKFTGLHWETERERWIACCEVVSAAERCCGSVAPLQTAGRAKLAFFYFCPEEEKKRCIHCYNHRLLRVCLNYRASAKNSSKQKQHCFYNQFWLLVFFFLNTKQISTNLCCNLYFRYSIYIIDTCSNS